MFEFIVIMTICVLTVVVLLVVCWVFVLTLKHFFNWPYDSLSEEKMIKLYFSRTRLNENFEET